MQQPDDAGTEDLVPRRQVDVWLVWDKVRRCRARLHGPADEQHVTRFCARAPGNRYVPLPVPLHRL